MFVDGCSQENDHSGVLIFMFRVLRMPDRANCYSDFIFLLSCTISFICLETSMTLSSSFPLFYVQSIASAIGFG